MKRAVLLVLPIIIVVTIVLTILGFFQVGLQQEKQIDELQRKAKALAESLEFSIRQILTNRDIRGANYVVETFEGANGSRDA